MRDQTQAKIINVLQAECDAAAQTGDAVRLRKLYGFMMQAGTNYVRLRLRAIESIQAGMLDDLADAREAETIAAEIVEGIKAP